MDIETLLAPVPGASPCGEDLSFSTEFDTIVALQQEDDPSLEQGVWVRPLKVADWDAVQAQCAELLTHRAKDLRLVAWWAEARTRSAGYAGMRQGLALAAEVCERFWQDLHPLPEDGDPAERIGNLNWFLQRVVQLSTLCPVTQRAEGRNYSLQDWRQARAGSPDAEPAPDEVTLAQFTQALKDTSPAFMQEATSSLAQCLGILSRWQAWMGAQLGTQQGPNFVHAREALEQASHEVHRLGREAGLMPTEPADAPEDAPPPVAATAAAVARVEQGPIQTAQDALARLREVAEFFHRTQPHSPVAYLVDKAVKWGDMSLHDWLRAVVKDGGTLAGLEELLGVAPSANH